MSGQIGLERSYLVKQVQRRHFRSDWFREVISGRIGSEWSFLVNLSREVILCQIGLKGSYLVRLVQSDHLSSDFYKKRGHLRSDQFREVISGQISLERSSHVRLVWRSLLRSDQFREVISGQISLEKSSQVKLVQRGHLRSEQFREVISGQIC